jgi:hypothetical protein
MRQLALWLLLSAVRLATASPSIGGHGEWERSGQPGHRSHNPRGQGEKAGCDRVNPRRGQPNRLIG